MIALCLGTVRDASENRHRQRLRNISLASPYHSGTHSMDTSTTARHIAELQSLVIGFSDKLQEQFLAALENRLMEMADMAKNNEQQWKLLQLSRELKRQKAVLGTIFKKHLAQGFQQFQRNELGGKDTRKEDMSADLSLVADDELEQNLAATSLSRRAETRFAEVLFALNQRMAVLNGGRKLAEDGNPLGPYQFADALQAEIVGLKLDTRMTVLFFRVFEKSLLENLGELYQNANSYLIKQGVLPNLRYGVGNAANRSRLVNENKPSPPAPTPAAPAATPAPEHRAAAAAASSSSAEETHAVQQQLYNAILELQQRGAAAMPIPDSPPPAAASIAARPSSPGATSGAYSPGYFSQPAYATHGNAAIAACSQGEVITALAAVPTGNHAELLEQNHVPPAMTVAQYQAVTQQIRQEIGDEKRIGDDDSRIIDLVGMIFEYMLGDKQLPDSVKAVLSYLHTPYLKAAFIDRALFEKPEHPSRQLLNCLAEAGTRWVANDGDSQFKVFPRIKSVVRRVLTEFRQDVSLFDELLAEMQEFNSKVEHSISLMERRAREKAEGEERLKEVKRRVLFEIRKRMQGFELPSHMVVLLLHPWSDYLTFTLLRHGEDSHPWQEGLDTVGDLIWSIQPKTDNNERNRLMLVQETLQTRVQTALETIAYDQSKSNKLLDALHQSQLLALQNLSAEPIAAEKLEELETEASADLDQETPDVGEMDATERELVEKLRLIEFGTWMEFDTLDHHHNLRAKIAWFNAHTSRYMLVDRSGKQVAMKSGLDIARLILSHQARIIAGASKPFFERALENIFARLKSAVAH